MSDCPKCGKNLALVGRVHQCVPVTIGVTTPAADPAEKVVTRVVTRKRCRAAYMREYRARRNGPTAVNGVLGFGC